MIIAGTDSPLSAGDLKRLATRAVFGLARTGSSYSNGTGDFAVSFSSAESVRVKPGTEPATYTNLPSEQAWDWAPGP